MWRELFPGKRPLIGVIHLPPLPGAPRSGGEPLEAILERALRDLSALEEGGADAAIVENFGDRPFAKTVDQATVAQMAVVVRELRRAARIPLGVNVLRSDGVAALSVAHAAGAAFIRVNVFSGVALTDQGLIEGCAREVLALRKRLGARVAVLADVHVKHAFHFGDLADAARDAARNGADALIVTGRATGAAPDPADLRVAQEASGLPVLVGSGVTPENVGLYSAADGFIVGTWLKREGRVEGPVDPARVRRLAQALRAAP
ncbi:MAG: BtpA/SgcQ family protein [Candidatus Bipolaricaulota bacterium]|nr:BtpA/SgcQ family protein [Candidatus Bipolaricaulota bacterium]MCX7844551.1 BtpA/SgcQ family protein [Candidatus Bipolaricaulota bacterium]MDW8152436.1 BtpA/SgcQ family protein [Candidatus Bipolaricaulota bacterium]